MVCRCNSTGVCLKCRVWTQPHQTAYQTALLNCPLRQQHTTTQLFHGILGWKWLFWCRINLPYYILNLTQLILACAIDSALLYCRNCHLVAILTAPAWNVGFGRDPTKTALRDDDTQQPTFPMEFQGGNDCFDVALIGPIIYSNLGLLRPLLLWFLNKWLLPPLENGSSMGAFSPPSRICIGGKMALALGPFSTWC